MNETVDLAVIGGGPVGAAFALAVAAQGFAPLVVDPRLKDAGRSDPRPIALSYGSRLILERLGVWTAMGAPTPIERIHVSQQGGFGRATLSAVEAGVPALGYVVDYGHLHGVLADTLAARLPGMAVAARVARLHPEPDRMMVELDDAGAKRSELRARLAVVADGGTLRGLTSVRELDYGQTALVATVRSENPHANRAFERFTPEGPLALLPFREELALIWTAKPLAAQELCSCPERDFLVKLGERFGGRLGSFSAVGARHAFPLALKLAQDIALPRAVPIGNAAQTLHPVAGQGFNLGLRDAWELAALIARTAMEAVGAAPMLAEYRRRRRLDRRGGVGFTDFLVRAFSNDIAPLRAARGAGLALLGAVPPARDFVVRRMMFGARG